MFKREERNKVGRPKLADSKTKRKSIITLSIALTFVIALVIGGIFDFSVKNHGRYHMVKASVSQCSLSVNSSKITYTCSGAAYASSIELSGKFFKVSGKSGMVDFAPMCDTFYAINLYYRVGENKSYKTSQPYSKDCYKQKGSDKNNSDKSTDNKRNITTTTKKPVTFKWNTLTRYTYENGKNDSYFVFDKTSSGVSIRWGYEGPGSSIIGDKEQALSEYSKNRSNNNSLTIAFDRAGTYTIYAWDETDKSNINSVKIKVLERPGKCNVVASGGNKASYKASCTHSAKVKSVHMVLSNKKYNVNNKINKNKVSGIWGPDYYSSFVRKGYVYIKYIDGVTNDVHVAKTKVFMINTKAEYKKACIDNKGECNQLYHIDDSKTYCRAFVYDLSTSGGKYAIRCDVNAMPWRVEVIDEKENQVEKALDGKDYDINWKNNWGYSVSNNKYIKNLKKGKTYILRLTYLFADIDKNGKTIIRMTRSDAAKFTTGKQLESLANQIKKTRFKKMESSYAKTLNNGKCNLTAIGGKGQINYELTCGVNSRPVSLRLTASKNHHVYERYYSNSTTISYKSVYTNNQTLNVLNKKVSGIVRTGFGTEAQTKNTTAYGMSEKEGLIKGLEAGTYNMQLYYTYKDPITKKLTEYILVTSGETKVTK